MQRKTVCAGLILMLLLAVSVQAGATENYGEILVWIQQGEEMFSGGSLEIYRAGTPVPEGYVLGGEFGGGIVAGEDIPSRAFAQWMAERAGPGILCKVGRNGLCRFEDLEPGMYLIRQGEQSDEYKPIDPFLACVSQELRRVDTYPKVEGRNPNPKTGQSYITYLAVISASGAIAGLTFVGESLKKKYAS